jgi:hypothetical protein
MLFRAVILAMKSWLIILLLSPLFSDAQSVRFRTIKLETKHKGLVKYPIVKYHDNEIAQKINSKIAAGIFHEEIKSDSDFNVKLCELLEYTSDMYHTVTYNKKNVLSFNVFAEGCGAYCTSSYKYFNFDLLTGEELSWTDLMKVEKKDSLESLISGQIRKELLEYSRSEARRAAEKDSSTYEWVKDTYEECLENISITGFTIYPDRIEFEDKCDFAHAIQNFGPGTAYSWSLTDLAPYLKPRFLSLLSK